MLLAVRFNNNQHVPGSISPISPKQPCEIRNTANVKLGLQQDITEENGIKSILASSKCFQHHVPYI